MAGGSALPAHRRLPLGGQHLRRRDKTPERGIHHPADGRLRHRAPQYHRHTLRLAGPPPGSSGTARQPGQTGEDRRRAAGAGSLVHPPAPWRILRTRIHRPQRQRDMGYRQSRRQPSGRGGVLLPQKAQCAQELGYIAGLGYVRAAGRPSETLRHKEEQAQDQGRPSAGH